MTGRQEVMLNIDRNPYSLLNDCYDTHNHLKGAINRKTYGSSQHGFPLRPIYVIP